jgi:hypothetical protein
VESTVFPTVCFSQRESPLQLPDGAAGNGIEPGFNAMNDHPAISLAESAGSVNGTERDLVGATGINHGRPLPMIHLNPLIPGAFRAIP